MKRAVWVIVVCCACRLAVGQTSEARPSFEIAGIQPTVKSANSGLPYSFFRASPVRGGRYELKSATMVDLIRTAYGFDADKVLGGPNWLEMDRFDVLAKVPAGSTPEQHKLMLQSLLEDRFKLVTHKDTRPLPTYALTVGKKVLMKEADGTEETGCKPKQASGPPAQGGVRLMTSGPTGVVTTLNLGPGMVVEQVCRNMTSAAIAESLRSMMGASLGPNPVLDETGLKGRWNYEIRYSMQLSGLVIGEPGERITLVDAVEKQLGLKLEERPVSTPVIVVDKVNRTPTGNPPGLAEALPPLKIPTEFEVASVKPSDPAQNGPMMTSRIQPGGRFTANGLPLRSLITRAFNSRNSEQIVDIPKWADNERFDIVAKAPSEGPDAPPLDMETVVPMLRSLLVERFKMKYHTEDRPVTAYDLVAAKPKMKKADPESRTWCKTGSAPAGSPPGSRALTCQNITMAQLADQLQNMASELSWPVKDATGVEGGWDFTLVFGQAIMFSSTRPAEAAPPAGGEVPAASEPAGGYTLFQAIERQLGLKLEPQKRPMPVIVIDHLEQKPIEN